MLQLAVIGAGYWGPNLIRNFRSLPNCALKLMCDKSEERLTHLKSLYPEVQGETDFEVMLKRNGLDAVAIATAAAITSICIAGCWPTKSTTASTTAAPTRAWPWPPPNSPTCWAICTRALCPKYGSGRE